MDPLTNLQVAVKNNIDVFYFSCVVPMYVFFVEAGQMGTYFFKSPIQHELFLGHAISSSALMVALKQHFAGKG